MEELYEFDPVTRQYRRRSLAQRDLKNAKAAKTDAKVQGREEPAGAIGVARQKTTTAKASQRGGAPLPGFSTGKFLFWIAFYGLLALWVFLLWRHLSGDA